MFEDEVLGTLRFRTLQYLIKKGENYEDNIYAKEGRRCT